MIIYEKINRELIKANQQNTDETYISFEVIAKDKSNPQSIEGNEEVTFRVEINSHKNYGKSWVNICIDNNEGATIGHIRNDWYDHFIDIGIGKRVVEITVKDISLTPGVYNFWSRVVLSEEMKIYDSDIIPMEVKGRHLYGHIAYQVNWKS